MECDVGYDAENNAIVIPEKLRESTGNTKWLGTGIQ
jgi:hypothetical protein